MLVFFDPKRSTKIFLIFWKKSKKWEKVRFFHFFSYGLSTIFTLFVLLSIMQNMRKKSWKKNTKKRDFIFWNSFLKMKIGHLFLSIFEFKKKVYKKGIRIFLNIRWNGGEYIRVSIKKANYPRKMRIEFSFIKKWILDYLRINCFFMYFLVFCYNIINIIVIITKLIFKVTFFIKRFIKWWYVYEVTKRRRFVWV